MKTSDIRNQTPDTAVQSLKSILRSLESYACHTLIIKR